LRTTSETVIEVVGFHQRYGNFEAVRGVDFAVASGEVVALLGPNGAGKTSTIEVLEGFRPPSRGSVRVLGLDPVEGGPPLRQRVGIVLQEAGLLPDLTVTETVTSWRRFYRAPLETADVIARVGLERRRDVRIRNLSGGERRRLDIALAILGRPEVLFLDEPTTGLDPAARRRTWDLVRSLVHDGTTALMTSHYMDEVEALADRVIVMAEGRVVAEATPGGLRARASVTTILFELPRGVPVGELPDLDGAAVTRTGGRVQLTTTSAMWVVNRLSSWALETGTHLEGFTVSRPSLEAVYLDLIGSAAGAPPSGQLMGELT